MKINHLINTKLNYNTQLTLVTKTCQIENNMMQNL